MTAGRKDGYMNTIRVLIGRRGEGMGQSSNHEERKKILNSSVVCHTLIWKYICLLIFFLPPKFPIAPRESILPVYYMNLPSLASQSVTSVSPIIIPINQ